MYFQIAMNHHCILETSAPGPHTAPPLRCGDQAPNDRPWVFSTSSTIIITHVSNNSIIDRKSVV